MPALAAVNRLLDLGMIRGRVLVVGPDADAAVGELRLEGVNATATDPERPGWFDAVVDGGGFAAAGKKARAEVVERLGSRLRTLGTLFVAGRSAAGSQPGRGRFSPADVRAGVDADHFRQHPAINFGGRAHRGLIVPVQRVTGPVSGVAERVGTRSALVPSPVHRLIAAGAATAPVPPGAVVERRAILDPAPIVAVQECDSWCWAAALQMLCKSQGFDVPQETFVKRVFGVGRNGRPPCVMSGPMENIKAALDGTVGEANGQTVRLTSTAVRGVPQGPQVKAQITALQAGRPYLFGFDAHAYVCHGVTWLGRQDGTGRIQITRMDLIDPFPTRRRHTFITFPTGVLTLMKIHGLLMLNVTRV